jgi:GT2 family glycosyltransferase
VEKVHQQRPLYKQQRSNIAPGVAMLGIFKRDMTKENQSLKSTTEITEQELVVLKERVKFFLNIRKLANERQGNESLPFASMCKLLIKTAMVAVFKFMVTVLPKPVLLNKGTYVIFKFMGRVLDRQIREIREKVKSSYELFKEGVPTSFELPHTDSPLVSIVVPVHNKYEFTHKCIYGILQHSTGISYEVIIADDASTDETADITNRIKNVIVNHNPVGLGFLKNCNAAAKRARGKYVLLLNNDTIVQPEWLSSLLGLMEKDGTIGMTGSMLVYPEGLLQEAGGIVWSDASGWNYGRLEQPDSSEYNYVKEVDYISGASIMVRRDLWEKLGGFDERYAPAYFEDSDLAFAIRKLGYKVVYQPKSIVVHFEGISHGTDLNEGIKSYQVSNRQKFIDKWKEELRSQCENGKNIFVARERSAGKKTILVVDHYVPEYDKDAGSRTTFQYLNLFLDMGLNVKFIGDNFINREPYTSVLQQKGIEVLYGYYYEKHWQHWVRENSRYIDYVFLNRPHIAAKYIDFIRKNTSAKIIYYGHDLHFLREQRQYEVEQKKHLLHSAEIWKHKESDLFHKSDLVLYPSMIEVAEVKKIDPKIDVHAIQSNLFEHNTGNRHAQYNDDNRDLLFVGGFNHPPNVDAVLWFVKEIFPRITAQDPDIKFIVVGSKVTDQIMKLQSDKVIIKGFVSDEELADLYETCRIVIAPLRYGAGIKGKIVEAIYYRSAVVTTSTGVEGLCNTNGLIAVEDDAAAFAQKTLELYHDAAALEQKFNDSPEFIRQYFSKENAMKFIREKML